MIKGTLWKTFNVRVFYEKFEIFFFKYLPDILFDKEMSLLKIIIFIQIIVLASIPTVFI